MLDNSVITHVKQTRAFGIFLGAKGFLVELCFLQYAMAWAATAAINSLYLWIVFFNTKVCNVYSVILQEIYLI